MTAYVTSPFALRAALLTGVNAYSFGSFDQHNPGSHFSVTNVALTSNVATVSLTLREGPIPVVGALISLQGTQTTAGLFNVTNVALASVSIDKTTGVGTVTFALTHADVASTPDAGAAIVSPPEVAEAMTQIAGKQFAMQSQQGFPSNSRDISWVTATPSAPGSYTAALQVADVDQDSEYTTVDTMTAPGLKIVLGVRANFIRINITAVSGGTNPTIIAKILE